MASRMVLLGMVPVWTHTPPIVALRSINATRLPILAAEMAAFWPAGPLPITTRSYLSFCMCARRRLPPADSGRIRAGSWGESHTIHRRNTRTKAELAGVLHSPQRDGEHRENKLRFNRGFPRMKRGSDFPVLIRENPRESAVSNLSLIFSVFSVPLW